MSLSLSLSLSPCPGACVCVCLSLSLSLSLSGGGCRQDDSTLYRLHLAAAKEAHARAAAADPSASTAAKEASASLVRDQTSAGIIARGNVVWIAAEQGSASTAAKQVTDSLVRDQASASIIAGDVLHVSISNVECGRGGISDAASARTVLLRPGLHHDANGGCKVCRMQTQVQLPSIVHCGDEWCCCGTRHSEGNAVL